MSEQEKKRRRINDILNAEIMPKTICDINGGFFSAYIKPRPLPFLRYIGRFENKTNATSHQNVGLFMTAIEEEQS